MSGGWIEVGDRSWYRRYPEWDVNVGVVAGGDGLLVIDTRATLAQGRALRDDVRELGDQPIRWIANTHVHFDHTFGNAAFVDDVGDEIYAHANAAAALPERGEWIKQQCRDHPEADPEYPDISEDVLRDVVGTPLLVPPRTFSLGRSLDLGDREVQLSYLGRGHTDGDIVVFADGAVFAGDLIEESGNPSFGNDCFPLDWPGTLAALVSYLGEAATVVPGHGVAVQREFLYRQAGDVRTVAATISQLHAAGVTLDDALKHPDWPYPRESLDHAIRRGYAALGPTG